MDGLSAASRCLSAPRVVTAAVDSPTAQTGQDVLINSYLMSPTNDVLKIALEPGKYVVGRSSVPLDDKWFINLESPRSAVSRAHATLILCRNGDAWLEDNCSTNGTFLVIRDGGEGLRLEPQHFYQLSSGALILFGDTEMRFMQDEQAGVASTAPLRSGIRSQASQRALSAGRSARLPSQNAHGAEHRQDSLATLSSVQSVVANGSEHHASNGATRGANNNNLALDQSGVFAAAAATLANRDAQPSSSLSMGTVPNNMLSNDVKPPRSPTDVGPSSKPRSATNTSAPPEVEKVAPAPPQQPPSPARLPGVKTERAARTSELAEPPARRLRRDDNRTFTTFGKAIEATLTGFDSRARAKYTRLITAKGGKVSDDWSPDCNLLVVNDATTTRTPKLIMAVGSGADVVIPAFIDNTELPACDACPAVKTETGTIPAAKLRDAIVKYRDVGAALLGRTYNTADVNPKGTRDQLNVIIKACGGNVSAAKPGKGKEVTAMKDAHLDAFYNAILSGDAPYM
jgi:hypothetical protein